MNVLLVHNDYGDFSGEEAAMESLEAVLKSKGHSVGWMRRSSTEIDRMTFGRVRAFFRGIYSARARREMRRLLSERRPDIVHVQNVFPLISPSVLVECRRAGVPVVMTLQNYRLVCPTGLHLRNGRVCEKCAGGNEYLCVLYNCERSLFRSLGYALRNYVARKTRLFRDNVTLFICLTEFHRQRLIRVGYPEDRLVVLPNMTELPEPPSREAQVRPYVGYIGRISPEKGVPLLLEAARKMPEVPFRAVGACERMPELSAAAPPNFSFLGPLPHARTGQFYASSRFIVLPSTWFEGLPLVLLEAMAHFRPVVAPRIGGIPEVVDDGETGLLFQSGDVDALTKKIHELWHNPQLCERMGLAAREKVRSRYSPDAYYRGLMHIYEKALRLRAVPAAGA